MGSSQALDLADIDPVMKFERAAELLQPLDMKVDRPRADVAAAGHGHARLAETCQERTEDIEGCAHSANQVVGSLGSGQVRGVYLNGAVVAEEHACAQTAEYLSQRIDIADARHIA